MQGRCYTCLNAERNVKILDNIRIKTILFEWFNVGAGNFKVNLDEFKVCWECKACLIRISKFKHQVFKSQKIRLNVAQKKSSRLRNLSKLSIYTKNTYDITFEHVEGSNGLNSLNKSQQKLDDTPSNDGKISKKKGTRKPEKGKRKLSITLGKNKEKVTQEHSKDCDDDSDEIKEKPIEDNNDESDSSDKNKETSENEDDNTDILTILNVGDVAEDVKLRSHPYVLLEREKHKRDSSHSKHRHRKRRHGTTSIEVEKENPKRQKTGAANVDTNALNDVPNVSNIGSCDTNVGTTSEDAAQESSDSTADLPVVKFSIVHLTEEQMVRTREMDRNDRVFGNRAFKCQRCIIGFAEMGELDKHNKEKHSVLNGPLICRICDTRFKKPGFLELHQQTHYRSYRCRRCPFEHHRRYVIESHVVKEHGLKPSPVCSDCDMEFDSQQLLMSHYETEHKDRLKCNICGESFNTYARVRKHAAKHKGIDEDCEFVAEIFHCTPCNYTFEGRAIYRAHMQFAHSSLAQDAYCADCDVHFSTIHGYKQHLENSQKHALLGEKIFDCAHCMSKFLTKEALLAHIVRSHRLLSHSCAICNKGFSDQLRLKSHIQAKHPEVIPVNLVMDKICQICSKKFSARSELLDHMRSHTAEKLYQCKTCEKRFAVEHLLKKHIQRMHKEDHN